VNAYEVQAGMVYLQCKNCVTFWGEILTMGRYTNLRIFTFTFRGSALDKDANSLDRPFTLYDPVTLTFDLLTPESYCL